MGTDELTCRELVEVVTDYLEGAMPAADRTLFEAHLAECDGCTEYVHQMRRTIRIVGSLEEASLSPSARDRLLAAFRDWKRERSGP